jgi:hypothetical protein
VIGVYAHIGGMPVEETLAGFAPAGFVFVAALHVARERARRSTTRVARWAARVRKR